MPPLRRAGHVCRPSCPPRTEAMLAGEFFFVWALGAWAFRAGPFRADGAPITWDCCPFCGGDLPNPIDNVLKALEEDDAA